MQIKTQRHRDTEKAIFIIENLQTRLLHLLLKYIEISAQGF